jgi:hypothetical protein
VTPLDKIHELCKIALTLPDSPDREDAIDRLKAALDEYSEVKRDAAARQAMIDSRKDL